MSAVIAFAVAAFFVSVDAVASLQFSSQHCSATIVFYYSLPKVLNVDILG